MNYPSKIIEDAVETLSSLPGIGKRTALRMVLNMTQRDPSDILRISESIERLGTDLERCAVCDNFSDDNICNICSNPNRKDQVLCVVETAREVMAIENTQFFNGKYHLLGGIINPIEGIGPDDLRIEELVSRVRKDEVEEIIMAVSPSIEGDTTVFYISKLLKEDPVKISCIARGVAFGGELEYTDEHTLAKSLQTRIPYSV